MWSRVVEVMLGVWLAISPFVFAFERGETLLWINALGGGAAVVILALVSVDWRFDRWHFGILAVAAWLAVHVFVSEGAKTAAGGAPPPYQNELLTALLLGLVALLPTRSYQPPRSWIAFYAREGRR